MPVCLTLVCLGRSKRHFGKKRLCLRKEREILSVAPFCEPCRVLRLSKKWCNQILIISVARV